MWILLVWAFNTTVPPTVLPGFSTEQTCKAAGERVVKDLGTGQWSGSNRAVFSCIEKR